jgi:uncharacterized membrane protein YidH (DUF202 family)
VADDPKTGPYIRAMAWGVGSDSLQDTLKGIVRSGTDSNPALNTLLGDYMKYHVVLVVVGGLFLIGLAALCVIFWRRFAKAPKGSTRGWSFERRTYFCFGALSLMVTLFMALVVLANVSNVVNPQHGFAGAIPLLGTPSPGTSAEALQQSFATWLQSGSTEVPDVVQGAIDDRLSWQRPKAIICTVLLVAFLLLCAVIWRALIRKSRVRTSRRTFAEWSLLGGGIISVGVCLLLMLMVIGNTQGSIAPISLTLFYG